MILVPHDHLHINQCRASHESCSRHRPLAGPSHYSPVWPPASSLTMSRWPTWRAYSWSRWNKIRSSGADPAPSHRSPGWPMSARSWDSTTALVRAAWARSAPTSSSKVSPAATYQRPSRLSAHGPAPRRGLRSPTQATAVPTYARCLSNSIGVQPDGSRRGATLPRAGLPACSPAGSGSSRGSRGRPRRAWIPGPSVSGKGTLMKQACRTLPPASAPTALRAASGRCVPARDAKAAAPGQPGGVGSGLAGLSRRRIRNPGSLLSFS